MYSDEFDQKVKRFCAYARSSPLRVEITQELLASLVPSRAARVHHHPHTLSRAAPRLSAASVQLTSGGCRLCASYRGCSWLKGSLDNRSKSCARVQSHQTQLAAQHLRFGETSLRKVTCRLPPQREDLRPTHAAHAVSEGSGSGSYLCSTPRHLSYRAPDELRNR